MELTFEDKMNKLETLIKELESNENTLEKSIEKYTEAIKLVKECDKELKTAEEKVAKMVVNNKVIDFNENI